tara:strand:+ start:436 stop:687 length:252 start_codon:yes stop_codon:yes gene_type:complete
MHIEKQILKQAWFNMDHSNTPVRKEIIVEMDKYPGRKGQGTVQILSEGPDSYSSFKTHQETPMKYAKDRKEYISGGYKLVIKD